MKATIHNSVKASERGHAIVEVALMAPWIFLLFIAIFDFGFYAFSLISVQNAARVAALHTSSDRGFAEDQVGACELVRMELDSLLNKAQFDSTCSALPLKVEVPPPDTDPDGAQRSSVTVSYETVPLIPIPGLPGKFTFKRTVSMKVLSR